MKLLNGTGNGGFFCDCQSLCPTSVVLCDIFFRDFYDHSFRGLPLCSIWWKGNRLFVFLVLSHSHDNRETLKVVVQGFLADAGAESQACL